ncbi:exo-beta-N-acetylmuramidase NamZ family protein [Foetidibacter luteolus]|uniref:exo-beta-N-acetylmuramidase NamZ family protein n=1 Tax=Foetidibacter luteolus TaxID=2608880 RepID=UPI00129A6D07|nr:DUF1343 domain-containing protein [Foetidibacter luteolus]
MIKLNKILPVFLLCTAMLVQCAYAGHDKTIRPGAYQLQQYLPLLKNKRVGLFANPTSVIGQTHLADTLQKLGVHIVKIFGPEHGFRGNADAGEKVATYTDEQTGITVISLYGAKNKPSPADLSDVDIMLFDIQDVGVRFYTYISSLEYFLEAAIQNDKPLVILDRPNPNGFYVDGPVLQPEFKSFVGMQPVPVVYGMTMGEYASMLLGEGWLPGKYMRRQDKRIHLGQVLGFEKKNNSFNLTVIKCQNYTHKSRYILPVKPSPNLPDMSSVYWYPSTCFFEGTVLSEGRGTSHPFQVFGHPSLPQDLFAFTPQPNEGAKNPKLNGQLCYGWNLADSKIPYPDKIALKWLLQAYQLFPGKDNFFLAAKTGRPADYFFNKLAGNAQLMQQIKAGITEQEIRASWQPALTAFKKIRSKYLLYAD